MKSTKMHTTIPARELRKGDLLRIGVSTNYVLVADATEAAGQIKVTIYNGEIPNDEPTLSFPADQEVALSAIGRDLPPDAHTHTPDPYGIGISVSRADGSHIHASECTICGKPIHRVAGFGILPDNNPNPWTLYDPADRTPLEQIQPVPEAGVTVTQADCLTTGEHAGMQIRLRDGAPWYTLTGVSEIDDDCHITLTTSGSVTAEVWATRMLQIRATT